MALLLVRAGPKCWGANPRSMEQDTSTQGCSDWEGTEQAGKSQVCRPQTGDRAQSGIPSPDPFPSQGAAAPGWVLRRALPSRAVIQAFILATSAFLRLLLGFMSTSPSAASQAPALGQRPQCRDMWAASTEHRLRGVDPQPDPGHRAATPIQVKPVAQCGSQVGTGIPCPFTALTGLSAGEGFIPLSRRISKLTALRWVSLKGLLQEAPANGQSIKCPSANPGVLTSQAHHVGTPREALFVQGKSILRKFEPPVPCPAC